MVGQALLHTHGLSPLGKTSCGWLPPFTTLSLLPTTAELRLEGNFLHRLPNEVSTLQHLKAIDLSRNQFRDFPEQLTTLPALETINLEENDIVGEWPWPCGLCSSHCLLFLPLRGTWGFWVRLSQTRG